ncbi:TPA: hypothetical protein HA265_06765 [Candidatus Woesearchaeota archaeon]|nr:hypothetical protein [Candidatus Woesearchaeota archaeon]
MSRQKVNFTKYLAVFAITTLIFIVGILVGNYFSSQKLEQIDYIGQDLKTDTLAMELQYEIIAENPCEHVNSTPLQEELYEMASKLDYMENRLGEGNRDVLELKKQYSLLEIRHWLFMKKTNKECGVNNTLILYFYSNEDDCPKCKTQGFILTWIRKNYPSVYVYAFDYNIENAALQTLKELYGVEGTPAMVIDKETYNEFIGKEMMEKIVQRHGAEKISDETPFI